MSPQNKQQTNSIVFALLIATMLISCIFVGESMANKDKGEDIILYNGNIVLRGGKGKGKGGSIVVANSAQGGGDMGFMMPFMFGRRR